MITIISPTSLPREPRPRCKLALLEVMKASCLVLLLATACGAAKSPVDGPVGTDGPIPAADGTAPSDGASSRDAPSPDTRADQASPDGGEPRDATTAWPAVRDYGAPGPFAVVHETNTGPNGAYDIFRPTTLASDKRRHPVISWANGTLFDIPDYQKLLEHWASHGFVVIAAQTNSTAGGGTHKAGIDWLLAENARAGSAYAATLDPAKIGAAGHSQGGGATIAAGSNKPGPVPLVTTVPLMPLLSFESDKTIVARQAAPMLNINASMDDRDPSGAVATQIFSSAKHELVQATYLGVHEDAMSAAMLRPTLAWFRLQLMGDESARPLFYPAATCGLCTDAAWKEVRHKNVP
jgi:hypothetical protein